MKIVIAVTHLLGSGHLSRALTLARAFSKAGWQVQVISGGMPAPHLDRGDLPITQLPPLRSDGVDFARLLTDAGGVADPEYHAKRQEAQAQALRDAAPDVLVTELFPFGRRSLRDEFTHLLDTAQALPRRPLICCSIRDILAPPSKPSKATFADTLLSQFYDAVLVHSDPEITPLSLSWPVSDTVAARLHYTGFVAPPPAAPHPQSAGKDEVLVSAGGGDVGAGLFATAMVAARLDPDRKWRILLGGRDAAARIETMAKDAPPNLILEPARPDFRQLLYHARASISLCGYNTAMDILQSGCPALFVPFDDGDEVEQGLRAGALARLPGIGVLRNAELSASRLLAALDELATAPRRAPRVEGFAGGDTTVSIVTQLVGAQR
jgi:predicted glycosyltransferase